MKDWLPKSAAVVLVVMKDSDVGVVMARSFLEEVLGWSSDRGGRS